MTTQTPNPHASWDNTKIEERRFQVARQLRRDFIAYLNPRFYEDYLVSRNRFELVQDHAQLIILEYQLTTEFERFQKEGRTVDAENFQSKVQEIASLKADKVLEAYTGFVRESFPEKYLQVERE